MWRLRVVVSYDPATGVARQASRTVRGTGREADTALAAFVAEAQGGGVLGGATTVAQYLDRWLEHIEAQRSPTTIRGYREKLSRVREDLGSIKVAKLTAQHVDRAYERWLGEGTSPATVHGIHRVLSVALRQAEKWGVVDRAATRLATPPSRGVRHPSAVDPATVLAIVAGARDSDPVLAAAVVVSATTGMRRGELCGLRWSDVDLDGSAMHIRRAVKYGIDRKAVEGPTKTHQVRRVALDKRSVLVLREHRERQRRWAAEALVDLVEDPYVFTLDPSGSAPWLPDSYSHAFERIAGKVGVKIRLHDLRHFAATHAIAAGVDVRTVAGRLGHGDASTTLRVYSQFVVERDRQAADILGALLST